MVLYSLRLSANVGTEKTCLALPERTWKTGTAATFRPLLLKCVIDQCKLNQNFFQAELISECVAENRMECQLLSKFLIDQALWLMETVMSS